VAPRALNLEMQPASPALSNTPSTEGALGLKVGLSLDLSDFDDMFLKAPDKRKTPTQSKNKPNESSKRRKMSQAVLLLDQMRAQNILIALARVKLSFRGIRDVILNMDDQALSLDSLLNILDLLPTFQEATLLKKFNGDPNDLGEAEQFQMEMLTVPHISNRLRALISTMQLPSKIDLVEAPLKHLCMACDELMESVLFTQLLQTVLLIGNKLNKR
jgi:hypothetical protein